VTRDCLLTSNARKTLARFPVGGPVWIRLDQNQPQRSYLPSGLGYWAPVVAIVPTALLLGAWGWLFYVILQMRTPTTSVPQSPVATCAAGLPGLPNAHNINTDSRIASASATFTSAEGGFSASFPGNLGPPGTQDFSSSYGTTKLYTHRAEVNGIYYDVSYGDVPGSQPIQQEFWLNYAVNSSLQQSTLIEQHNTELNGVPGRAVTSMGADYYWSERIFYFGRRYYCIIVYMPRSRCSWPSDASAFLNSFHTTHAKH